MARFNNLLREINRKCRYIICLRMTVFVYIAFFSMYSILRHYTFLTSAYDLGIFMQSLWTTANGQGFFFNTPEWQDLGVYTHFGVHNQPVLFLLVPLYKIFPYAEFLLILQTVALGVGAITLFKLASFLLREERKAFYISLMYLANPLLHGINRMDFHPASLAVPFIFLIPYYLEKNDRFRLLISVLFVLSVKEDAGLVLISMGLFFILKELPNIKLTGTNFRRIISNRPAISLIIVGVIWTIVSIGIIKYYSGTYPYIDGKLSRYGDFKLYWDNIIVYTIISLGSVSFIPLFSPRTFLSALPLFAELYLSSYELMVRVGYPYPYMLMPFLFILSVYVIEDIEILTLVIHRRHSILKKKITFRNVLVFTLGWMLMFSPAFHLVQAPKYVNGIPFWELTEIHEEWQNYLSFLSKITTTISDVQCPIATQGFIFPHLANRNNTYTVVTYFKVVYVPNNSVVFLSRTLPDYNMTINALENYTKTHNVTYTEIDVNTVMLSCYEKLNKTDEFDVFFKCVTDTIIGKFGKSCFKPG